MEEDYFDFAPRGDFTYSEDPLYDLFISGYLDPSEMLADDDQLRELEVAVGLVKQFLKQAKETGHLIIG